MPIRYEPDHRSEQVSQLLFGETALIRDKKDEWIKIRTDFDSYSGWIEKRSVDFFSQKEKNKITKIISKPVALIKKGEENMYIAAGSEIPSAIQNGKFTLAGKTFLLKEYQELTTPSNSANLIHASKQFLNAPYLWGGRTVFGFDCSGFVQVVFKINGIGLPRDAKDQALKGKSVERIEDALPGDVLFFVNDKKEISHVGIYLEKDTIIHASISVKFDPVDQKGIYNADLKEYTHKLYCIKRYL